MSYAIIESGGKQYKVEPGDWIKVEKLESNEGSLVELDKVLAVSDDNKTVIGNPLVEGARVTAKVTSHGKDKKIIVFKFKSKNRYRRKQGHRQNYTQLNIEQILTNSEGTTSKAGEPSSSSKPKRVKSAKPFK